jgi:hypothetical protein
MRVLPAYPLFVKDPNFSLWSRTDCLNESHPQSWFGEDKPIYGFACVNGVTYCFLGEYDCFLSGKCKKAKQISLRVTAYTTEYEFALGEVRFSVRFVSPLPLNDLDLLSNPVCYMEYETEGADEVTVSLFVDRRIAYNRASGCNQAVRGCVIPNSFGESALMGLSRQLLLSNCDDKIGADWGYYYLSGERAYILDKQDILRFLVGDCRECEITCKGAEQFMGAVNTEKQGIISIGYDEIASIDYFGTLKKGWYLEDHTINEAIEYIWKNYRAIDEKLNCLDGELRKRATRFGEDYYDILVASLRQSIAGHKLIKGQNGETIFLSKENGSNGCIGTVDVSYPSMPLYLLYNTELVKGMMRPVLKFAQMPVWSYDFAPHDVGTYPVCCGQVYGLNRNASHYHATYAKNDFLQNHLPLYLFPAEFEAYDFNRQMPVEECANMLIMFAACYHYDKDIEFFKDYGALGEKWVKYLVAYGLKPENQLCTDDFAGHLKNNINLAIKATVGIACYAMLKKADGDKKSYEEFRGIAENFATEILAFGNRFSHLPLTWDSGENTFSMKYNLVFDKLLGLGLFPQEFLEREVDYYIDRMNQYGTPLDSRCGYTKSDWQMWCAALTDNEEKRRRFVKSLKSFLATSPVRIPFGDWFESEDGKTHHFVARTVQGGCFILLMLDNM